LARLARLAGLEFAQQLLTAYSTSIHMLPIFIELLYINSYTYYDTSAAVGEFLPLGHALIDKST